MSFNLVVAIIEKYKPYNATICKSRSGYFFCTLLFYSTHHSLNCFYIKEITGKQTQSSSNLSQSYNNLILN